MKLIIYIIKFKSQFQISYLDFQVQISLRPNGAYLSRADFPLSNINGAHFHIYDR